MEGKKVQKPRALLVFGAPCSGKTTFAEKFAKRFGVAFYDLDAIKNDFALTRKVILLLVEQVAKTGQTIVIEGGVGTEKEREEMRRILHAFGYSVSTIWIQTDVATIRARLKSKYKNVGKAKEVFDGTVSRLEAPAEDEAPIILSGKHTFETQVRHTLAALAE
jgi:predicted kinase